MDNKIKIAVCDDSVFDRDITQMYIELYLQERGIAGEIICFSSGTEFLATDLSQYALVFLDIYMEGINGVETARRIMEENPRMKIIFCSSSPEFVDEAIEIDVMRYFIKPIIHEKFRNVMDDFFLNNNLQ